MKMYIEHDAGFQGQWAEPRLWFSGGHNEEIKNLKGSDRNNIK